MPGLKSKRSSRIDKDGRTERRSSRRKEGKAHKKRTQSLMLLQQDLFVMTCTTVIRNIEEDGFYVVDQDTRDRFNARELYELALKEDIPWRKWNGWIRQNVEAHLERIGSHAQPQYTEEQYNEMASPQQQGTG